MSTSQYAKEVATGNRFEFGKNWARFLRVLNEDRIKLAERSLASRSRLSHQIDRMEKAGLVRREPCEEDRRGANAVLTDHGWRTLVDAAPTHVAGVREHLVDVLTDEEFAALGRACAKVADHLRPPECDSDA